MSRIYFAYGSNMNLAQMARRCPNSPLKGVGVLRGYRWIITSRGYANIIPDPQEMVEGLLFFLSAEDEIKLDHFEGVAEGNYRKAAVTVRSNGEALIALAYIDPIVAEGRPQDEYVERMNMAVRDAQLSPEYLQQTIRRFIPEGSRGELEG